MYKFYEDKSHLINNKFYYFSVTSIFLMFIMWGMQEWWILSIYLIVLCFYGLIFVQRMIFYSLKIDEAGIEYPKYGLFFRRKLVLWDDCEKIHLSQPRLRRGYCGAYSDEVLRIIISYKNAKHIKIWFHPKSENIETLKRKMHEFTSIEVEAEPSRFDHKYL